MPRMKLDIDTQIEFLSILDENGDVDESLVPDLDRDTLISLFRAMLLERRLDERMLDLQRQGRIGTFPPTTGQEAAHLGAVAALDPDDWLVPAFRETGAELYHGRSIESVLRYYSGFNEGTDIPENCRILPMSVPVGSQVLHAVGLAWALAYRGEDRAVMTFFGDGATSQGDFHEGLNCAAVFQAPVIFVCQNNQWAISVPLSLQTRSQTLVQKAVAYGIPGIRVDGNDILAVWTAAREAVERARSGGGPTLIECVTYRLLMHTTADDPGRYRTREEEQEWAKRDPLLRFAAYLRKRDFLTTDFEQSLEAEIKQQIQESIDRFEEKDDVPDSFGMFDHLYEQQPLSLVRQKQQFEAELEQRKEGRNE